MIMYVVVGFGLGSSKLQIFVNNAYYRHALTRLLRGASNVCPVISHLMVLEVLLSHVVT